MSARPVNFDTLHCDKHPHWSLLVEWRPDRWDPMTNAPREGYPILNVRGREADGTVIPEMHYACGDGDGLMPPFDGWFAPYPSGRRGFYGVRPVEWQPLTATRKAGASDKGETTNDE